MNDSNLEIEEMKEIYELEEVNKEILEIEERLKYLKKRKKTLQNFINKKSYFIVDERLMRVLVDTFAKNNGDSTGYYSDNKNKQSYEFSKWLRSFIHEYSKKRAMMWKLSRYEVGKNEKNK